MKALSVESLHNAQCCMLCLRLQGQGRNFGADGIFRVQQPVVILHSSFGGGMPGGGGGGGLPLPLVSITGCSPNFYRQRGVVMYT